MGNKINPTGFRLGITQEHRSKWFATSKTYPTLLQEDDKIRTFIQKKYSSAGISDVLIARKADQLELELKTARPGVIVGCLLYTSPSPRDGLLSRMPSSA